MLIKKLYILLDTFLPFLWCQNKPREPLVCWRISKAAGRPFPSSKPVYDITSKQPITNAPPMTSHIQDVSIIVSSQRRPPRCPLWSYLLSFLSVTLHVLHQGKKNAITKLSSSRPCFPGHYTHRKKRWINNLSLSCTIWHHRRAIYQRRVQPSRHYWKK